MQCNAPAADEVWDGNCLRNMGRLRAYACFRGARLDDTQRFVHNILTHTGVLAAPKAFCTMDFGRTSSSMHRVLPSGLLQRHPVAW